MFVRLLWQWIMLRNLVTNDYWLWQETTRGTRIWRFVTTGLMKNYIILSLKLKVNFETCYICLSIFWWDVSGCRHKLVAWSNDSHMGNGVVQVGWNCMGGVWQCPWSHSLAPPPWLGLERLKHLHLEVHDVMREGPKFGSLMRILLGGTHQGESLDPQYH